MSATINDFLFPLFLFAIYFCGVSILIHNPQKPLTHQRQSQEMSPASSFTDVGSDRPLTEPLALGSELEEIPLDDDEGVGIPSEPTPPEVEGDELPGSEGENPLYIQTEAIINNLNKRQSRKICQPLGIKQKCGRAEKSLLSIRTEIESLFKHDPEKVISVIQEKLPELISLPAPTPAMTEMAAS